MRIIDELKRQKDQLARQRQQAEESLRNDYYGSYLHKATALRELPQYIRVGNLVQGDFSYPALVQTAGISGVFLETDDANLADVSAAAQDIVLQMLRQTAPGYCSLTILDPMHFGLSFREIAPVSRPVVSGVEEAIDEQYDLCFRVANECLSGARSLKEYNASSGRLQPYRIILMADYPAGYEGCLVKLAAMARAAQQTGVFFIVTGKMTTQRMSHSQTIQEFTRHLALFRCGNGGSFSLCNCDESAFYNQRYSIRLIEGAQVNAQLQSYAQSFLRMSRDAESDDILDGLRIPIGESSSTPFNLVFGHDSDAYCALIGGQSGKGKSTLVNHILAGGIKKYTTEQLQFVLINCAGIGFNIFNGDPHMLRVCNSSNVDDCMEAVRYLDSLMQEREHLFAEAGVVDIRQYVNKTGRNIPRIIVIVDEFHVLFTGRSRDRDYVETVLVNRVIKIGRKFGVHFIGATQSLGGGVHRSMLNNIPLRIALGMTEDQSMAFLGAGNKAAAVLPKFNAVYNDNNGNLADNHLIKFPFLTDEDINSMITTNH